MSYFKSQLAKSIKPDTLEKAAERIQQLERYVDQEFDKIQAATSTLGTRGIQFEQLSAEPTRYNEGDLYYGIAGVFGGTAGLYIRDGNGWRKL